MMNRPFVGMYMVASLGQLLLSVPARAQSTSAPPAPQTQAPAPALAGATVIGEDYRIEIAGGLWATMPSTIMYSDTETTAATTSATGATVPATTVSGTNIDFKQTLGLKNQRLVEFRLVARVGPRHKFHLEFVPLYYRQAAVLTANLNFNGQSFLAGQTVNSSLNWSAWRAGYEYDVVSADRGYIGGIVGADDLVVNGTLDNGLKSGTAGVRIPMPGLGVIGRYYVAPRVSITGEFTGYDLPGGATSTHGHVFAIEGYGTVNVLKYIGIQGGYRSFDATHVFGSPLNTGAFTVRGPYIGGAVRF
jgi:hypothetical protein